MTWTIKKSYFQSILGLQPTPGAAASSWVVQLTVRNPKQAHLYCAQVWVRYAETAWDSPAAPGHHPLLLMFTPAAASVLLPKKIGTNSTPNTIPDYTHSILFCNKEQHKLVKNIHSEK